MMFTLRSVVSLSACLTLAAAVPARAQPAPAPAAAVEVAPNTCVKPGDAPPVDRTGTELPKFQKRLDAYKACVNEYAAANGAKANDFAAQSRAYSAAANKAIEDYNAYVTMLNDAAKK